MYPGVSEPVFDRLHEIFVTERNIFHAKTNNGLLGECQITVEEKNEFPHSLTENDVTISLDKETYDCKVGGSFTVRAKITVPEEYVEGSHKYIGYFAFLNNGTWEQVNAWWIDGGTEIYSIKMTIEKWEKLGRNTFVVSVFPSDNFATGGALCDNLFHVNITSDED